MILAIFINISSIGKKFIEITKSVLHSICDLQFQKID